MADPTEARVPAELAHIVLRTPRYRETVDWYRTVLGPTTSLYYRDPNGVQVELQIDDFATDEALAAWMRTGAFKQNPIGVEFDPDVLAARLDRGDPLDVLVRQGSAPRQG